MGYSVNKNIAPWLENTPQRKEAQLIAAAQNWLDAAVRQKGYDGILSACSYAGSADPVFAAEGRACLVWRDSVWRKCYEILAEIQAGQRQTLREEDLLKELPVMVWPGKNESEA